LFPIYDARMNPVWRMIDSNINRANEAWRVMEDAARFALVDADLCGSIKSLRHELRAIIAAMPIPPGALIANRDTPGDAGTGHTSAGEQSRGDLLEVVIAAGKRAGEAMRVLEETAKTIDENAAGRMKSLRYRAYEIEKQLVMRFGSGRATQWSLCVLLTQSLCKRPWREVLRGAIEGGADCLQVREKDMAGGELVRHVREVMAIATPQAGVIVNDRVDVALAAGADGVHVGQEDLTVAQVRAIAGRSLIVGVSTHDESEARAAVEAGADYCGLGAMFATTLKPARQPSGPQFAHWFVKQYPNVPHLAIGGITVANLPQLVNAGVRGIAVSTAVCSAENPTSAVSDLCSQLGTRSSELGTS